MSGRNVQPHRLIFTQAGQAARDLFDQFAAAARLGQLQLTAGTLSPCQKLDLGGRRNHHSLGRLRHGGRVAMYTRDLELEVQVRPRRPTGGTNGAQDLPLLDPLAPLNVNSAQVCIDRGAGQAMFDLHHVAITILPARYGIFQTTIG